MSKFCQDEVAVVKVVKMVRVSPWQPKAALKEKGPGEAWTGRDERGYDCADEHKVQCQ